MHALYACAGRPDPAPGDQLFDRFGRAFHHDFDPSIRAISDESRQAETLCLIFCRRSKKDALNSAGDMNTNASIHPFSPLMIPKLTLLKKHRFRT
jgi:hypothetical protein